MRMPFAAVLGFFAITTLMSSCQKELLFDTPVSPGGGGGGITPTVCNTYFPLTTGNKWTFNQGGMIQVNTVITPDTVINGKTFKRLSSVSAGVTNINFAEEENGNVYVFQNLAAGSSGASGAVLLNPLRTNAAVGEKWNDTITVNGFTERFAYTMVEKNIAYQVDTLHFSNVIHVQYKVRLDLPPVYTDELSQITDIWYAKCVGAIEIKNQAVLLGVTVNTTDNKIQSYTLH